MDLRFVKPNTLEFIIRGKVPFVYYESIKRDLKTRPTYECQCDERLKTKPEESTRLTYTGLLGELEHLKIKTRLIDEMFVSVITSRLLTEVFVYYESIKRELKKRLIFECRCDPRLKVKS